MPDFVYSLHHSLTGCYLIDHYWLPSLVPGFLVDQQLTDYTNPRFNDMKVKQFGSYKKKCKIPDKSLHLLDNGSGIGYIWRIDYFITKTVTNYEKETEFSGTFEYQTEYCTA